MKEIKSRGPAARRKWLLLTAAIVVAGVALVYFARPLFTQPENMESTAQTSASIDSASSKVPARNEEPRLGADGGASSKGRYSLPDKNFEQGRSALIARYGAESPQLASYILEWFHACARSSIGGAEDGPAVQAARKRLTEFCVGVPRLSDVQATTLYKKTVRIDFSTRLSQIEGAEGVDEALNFAEDYLGNAKDPFSVRTGLDYLEGIDVLSPPPSVQNSRTRQRMREIYAMARDSYICDAYGGCPASHPLSAKFCLETGCSALADYRSQVANNLSRTDLAVFNWYGNAIRTYTK